MAFNNNMRTYTLAITDTTHDVYAPDGALVVSYSRARIRRYIDDGFMAGLDDVMGLNMTLNMTGVIRPGSRIEYTEAADATA